MEQEMKDYKKKVLDRFDRLLLSKKMTVYNSEMENEESNLKD